LYLKPQALHKYSDPYNKLQFLHNVDWATWQFGHGFPVGDVTKRLIRSLCDRLGRTDISPYFIGNEGSWWGLFIKLLGHAVLGCEAILAIIVATSSSISDSFFFSFL
jgi:hypothetical protein